MLRTRGRGLFDPRRRIQTVMLSSACRRGLQCTYQVTENRLELDEVVLAPRERDLDQLVDGTIALFDGDANVIRTQTESEDGLEKYVGFLKYTEIDHPIRFNGSLWWGTQTHLKSTRGRIGIVMRLRR